MNTRTFQTRIGTVHVEWLTTIVGGSQQKNGIDIITPTFGIEVKSKCDFYSHQWAVHEYQYHYFEQQNSDRELYWAFVFYRLSGTPNKLRNQYDLEPFVKEREIWILPWDYVEQFPVSYPRTGPYRYVKKRELPVDDMRTITVDKKNTIYIPPDTALDDILCRY